MSQAVLESPIVKPLRESASNLKDQPLKFYVAMQTGLIARNHAQDPTNKLEKAGAMIFKFGAAGIACYLNTKGMHSPLQKAESKET